jgi:uncharacterized membrane protein YeaQ/YmgE (transglycosylase-associated protein family)
VHVITSIILGAIAGYIASRIVTKSGSGFLVNTVLGILGAVVGGYISDQLGWGGATGFGTIWYLFVSVIGAIVVLVVFRAISRAS